jgi:hypothetical protein
MATWWLAKSGKLLMLLAGLVVILDLVGRERLQGIQERAELRHDLSKELRRLYEHYDVIDELAGAIRGEAIFRGPVFSSTGGIPGAIVRGYELSKSPPAAIPPLFSLADVKEFVTRTTAAMHREFPGSAQHEDEISFEAAKFIELEANMAAGGARHSDSARAHPSGNCRNVHLCDTGRQGENPDRLSCECGTRPEVEFIRADSSRTEGRRRASQMDSPYLVHRRVVAGPDLWMKKSSSLGLEESPGDRGTFG